jgi:hypothetical protein
VREYNETCEQQKKGGNQIPGIHKVKDSSLKLILGEHALFAEFLRDFIPIDLLKQVCPSDIEDITERFLPLFTDQKDSDTVKRVNLKGEAPFFIIAVTEHESEVNYRASFKMLQYVALVLNDYEKEANRTRKGASFARDFKYPPVLPIVFYDGKDNWTAETNFFHKTEMNGVFGKYIPKFEYELVSLNQYSIADLARFGDALSLIMIIDKIKTPDGIKMLSALPEEYVNQLATNMPEHLKKLITDVITALLSKINVPKEEIEAISEKIDKRGLREMFAIENYDVQETRRQARLEGKIEGEIKGKIEDVVNIVKELHISVSEAMRITKLPVKEQGHVITELEEQHIVYTM